MSTLSWSSLQTILSLIYPYTNFSTLPTLLHFIQSLLHAICTSSIRPSSSLSMTARPTRSSGNSNLAKYSLLNEMCVGLCTASCMKELVEEAVKVPSETIIHALHEYVSIFLLFDTICMPVLTISFHFVSFVDIQDCQSLSIWADLLSFACTHNLPSLLCPILQIIRSLSSTSDSPLSLLRQCHCLLDLLKVMKENTNEVSRLELLEQLLAVFLHFQNDPCK